jgi:hypothetical protein
MDASGYDIVFSGAVAPDRKLAQVKLELARLFKTDSAAVERLFCGRPVIIKKGLDRPTAEKYKAVLEKAGALCELRVQAAVAPASAGAAEKESAMTIAPAGAVLTTPREISSPAFDLGHMSLAAAGADILEGMGRVVAAPLYDLSALSMAPPGIELVEARPEKPADLPDVGDLTVDQPGPDLDSRVPPAALPLPDISAITLAPPGTAVLRSDESRPSPAPPDITGLGFALEQKDVSAS